MPTDEVTIERVERATSELVNAFTRLLPQLSTAPAPDLHELTRVAENPTTTLLVARLEGEIVGTLALVTFALPTGIRAWIEDVIVDGHVRGRGVATALVRHATSLAAALGARNVDLTSRPSREAANRLYQTLGFELRETNVYRLSLETETIPPGRQAPS